MTVTESSTINIQPVAGSLGAVVSGVRLEPDLPEDVVARIRAAVLEHKVIYLRGQDHLDDDAQAVFARRLGDLTTAHPTVSGVQDQASVLPIDAERGRANSWHTDVTFVDRPPSFSLLRAVVLPPYGGDTVWANTVAAYQKLPHQLRELAEGLWARHTNDYDYAASHGSAPETEAAVEHRKAFTSTVYQTEHPVVRVHPETGERALLLGHFAQSFTGLPKSDFGALFALLQSYVTELENTVRWQWAPGDLAIWDNRSTQHYAVSDYAQDVPRRLHRVTVAGEIPVGVNGQHSVAKRGDAAAYSSPAAS
ncbi:taurine catabolism dioxygenase [Allosaccharopolyspora coralli]|uniref:Taurine catabolism dioxygenase n=1 Tax=Allosaccharopolyspora coralli TaxID=2665642 RepID=A0A5Q3QN84_9PSEU|nr:TauD/TfdA family dioxygenase [Allosaccharopolyspora coralli]QGK72217.1 taurine catabolism dioxygenase [Allosaccharopolyspora coralli]